VSTKQNTLKNTKDKIDEPALYEPASANKMPVEIFDVDKLSQKELNILKLPNQTVIHKLKKPNYEIVIDLNVPFDPVCAFIAVLSEATYRVKFAKEDQQYFNLQCSPSQNNHRFFYQPLLDYVKRLFL